jgi:hypothetical protein
VSRRLLVVALALLAGALPLAHACRSDPGPPRVKKLPKKDPGPALRGGGPPRSHRIASYQIEASLDAVRHTLAASQTLIWTNAGESPVDRLPFHLYLNAFKNERSLFMRTSGGELRGERASDQGWGWIEIESVRVGGVELVSRLAYPHAPDETVAELPLPEPVEPGSTIEVQFRFSAQLPEVFARTGYKGDFHLVAQWFPKIGVRVGPPEAERWDCEPFHAHSEFFADFGTYDVSLTVPSTHVVAATGILVAATEAPGGTRTFTYRAEDVHDFAWMADPHMGPPLVGQATVEDGTVEVRVYFRKAQAAFAERHLQAAIGAIERFSHYFVPYPWPIFTVVDPPVDAAGGAGGMEYPTFVTTAGDSVFARPGVRYPEMVTVHEAGHNWFQGILASNEPREPWLDEGVNEWATAIVMRDLYGARTSALDWRGWQADFAALRRAISEHPGSLPSSIATAAYAFVPDTGAFYAVVYHTTARALATLEHHVGSARFLAAMKAYAREFAFKHPTGRDLFATLERELATDLTWYFEPVFHQVGGIKLAVRRASCEPAHPPRGVFGTGPTHEVVTEAEAPDAGTFVCTVIVQNTGVVHVPVDIELVFADGATQRVHWDARGGQHWQRFDIERSSALAEVRIDPDRKIVLDVPTAHHVRVSGDGSASLRAAARVASWAQTLMQVVGP